MTFDDDCLLPLLRRAERLPAGGEAVQGLRPGIQRNRFQPRRQLIEVLRRFDLAGATRPFTRCLQCNRLLEPVEKESIAARLDEETRRRFEEFYLCPGCRRIY
ncbi:MAG: hypothetical protein HY717_22260, partial [Planctomycetes bacterium]|nr:hypothetical protein [Planctomycetota bacterium]